LFYIFAFRTYFELLPLKVEFNPEVLFVSRPEVTFPELEVVEFVFASPPDAVEFDCENAEVVNEAVAKTALIIVTVKIIPILNFVLLLLINYTLSK
jgi:hypothetical protein